MPLLKLLVLLDTVFAFTIKAFLFLPPLPVYAIETAVDLIKDFVLLCMLHNVEFHAIYTILHISISYCKLGVSYEKVSKKRF